jgi:WD40 repeat protein
VSELAFSPGGLLASIGESGDLCVWDINLYAKTQVKLVAAPALEKESLTHIAFSADGDYLAASSLDGKIYFWQTGHYGQPAASPTLAESEISAPDHDGGDDGGGGDGGGD